MKHLTQFFILTGLAVSISACQTTESNEDTDYGRLGAQGVGAIAGGLLGSQVGDGAGQIAATTAGAVVGGWLAGELFDQLSERDRAVTTKKTAKALSESPSDSTTRWQNPDSGATTSISPGNKYQTTQRVQIARTTDVAPPQKLKVIGAFYEAKTNANLRQAATTSSQRIGGLQEGETFNAVGSVKNDDWILVSRDGTSIGYIYSELAKPYEGKDKEVASVREPINLANADTPSHVKVDEVEAETTCREGVITVEKSGSARNQTFKACKAPDGAWEL